MYRPKNKRVAILSISREMLEALISQVNTIITKNGSIITFDGVPRDSQIIHIRENIPHDSLDLFIESDCFDEVPEGGEAPRLFPIIHDMGEKGRCYEYRKNWNE